jgi:hypothetical protein
VLQGREELTGRWMLLTGVVFLAFIHDGKNKHHQSFASVSGDKLPIYIFFRYKSSNFANKLYMMLKCKPGNYSLKEKQTLFGDWSL